MGTSSRSLAEFHERLADICGPAAAGVLRSMTQPKRQAYWLNPLVARPPDFEPPGEPVPGLDGMFSVAADLREAITRHEGARDGWLYPMNPSSLLAVEALAPRPGEEVLDLAAAPGGKTVLLAARMRNSGRIAAVEPVKGRFHRLRANLARCGVSNAQLYLADGRTIGRKVPERFDRVLLRCPLFQRSPHPHRRSLHPRPLETAQDQGSQRQAGQPAALRVPRPETRRGARLLHLLVCTGRERTGRRPSPSVRAPRRSGIARLYAYTAGARINGVAGPGLRFPPQPGSACTAGRPLGRPFRLPNSQRGSFPPARRRVLPWSTPIKAASAPSVSQDWLARPPVFQRRRTTAAARCRKSAGCR